jgi:hypothetical protein
VPVILAPAEVVIVQVGVEHVVGAGVALGGTVEIDVVDRALGGDVGGPAYAEGFVDALEPSVGDGEVGCVFAQVDAAVSNVFEDASRGGEYGYWYWEDSCG